MTATLEKGTAKVVRGNRWDEVPVDGQTTVARIRINLTAQLGINNNEPAIAGGAVVGNESQHVVRPGETIEFARAMDNNG